MQDYLNFKSAKILAVSAALAAVLGYLIGHVFFLSYKSTGLVRLSMAASDVKPFLETVKDPDALRQFISEQKFDDKNTPYETILQNTIIRQNYKWIEAIPKIGKADIKELGLDQVKVQGEDIIGFRISAQHRDPQVALALTNLQTQYALQVQIRESMEKWVRDTQLTAVGRIERYEASKLRSEREIDEIQTRLKEYRRVMQQYPEAARADSKPFISLEKGSERYLPIPNQMAVAELRLVDIKEQLAREEREKRKDVLELAFVKEIGGSKIRKTSIRDWLDESIGVVQKRLSTLTDERERIAALDLLRNFQGLRISYIDGVSFMSNPQVAERPQRPSPLLLAAILGSLALIAAALYITRQAWYKAVFAD